MSFTSCALIPIHSDVQSWLTDVYVKTWKNNPQNVYNLAAITAAMIILIVSLRLGLKYMKYVKRFGDDSYLPLGAKSYENEFPTVKSKKLLRK